MGWGNYSYFRGLLFLFYRESAIFKKKDSMLIRQVATKIVSKLQAAGHIAYFAGGWVRDFLLKVSSDDIDIATSASTEEIQDLFPKTIPVGIAFGIIIIVEEGHHFEVATFRKEKEYVDGRRPTSIERASPEEDALRRDFTINGMFYDPLKGKLLDFVQGEEDLKRKVIRAIGDPHHRFLEDRLRMIRAVRYSTRFEFPIHVDTEQAIISHSASLFPSVAIERVWQEFQKLSKFSTFSKGLEKLYQLNLLQTIFPSLKEVSPEEFHARLSCFPLFPKETPLIVELAHLFPNDSLEKHLELCDYMKVSRKDKEPIEFFHHAKSLLLMPLSWQENLEDSEWAHFYAHPLSSLFLDLYQSPSFHQRKRQELAPYIQRIQEKRPLLTASDLLQEGLLPGPSLGSLLKEAEKLGINCRLTNKQDLLQIVKKSPLWPKK